MSEGGESRVPSPESRVPSPESGIEERGEGLRRVSRRLGGEFYVLVVGVFFGGVLLGGDFHGFFGIVAGEEADDEAGEEDDGDAGEEMACDPEGLGVGEEIMLGGGDAIGALTQGMCRGFKGGMAGVEAGEGPAEASAEGEAEGDAGEAFAGEGAFFSFHG